MSDLAPRSPLLEFRDNGSEASDSRAPSRMLERGRLRDSLPIVRRDKAIATLASFRLTHRNTNPEHAAFSAHAPDIVRHGARGSLRRNVAWQSWAALQAAGGLPHRPPGLSPAGGMASSSAGGLAADMEALQLRTTAALQQIDANFSRANELAAEMFPLVRGLVKQLVVADDASKVRASARSGRQRWPRPPGPERAAPATPLLMTTRSADMA